MSRAQWLREEVDRVVEAIERIGERTGRGGYGICFGELVQEYGDEADALVSILRRGKKDGRVSYEGEFLYPNRDDEVWVSTPSREQMRSLPSFASRARASVRAAFGRGPSSRKEEEDEEEEEEDWDVPPPPPPPMDDDLVEQSESDEEKSDSSWSDSESEDEEEVLEGYVKMVQKGLQVEAVMHRMEMDKRDPALLREFLRRCSGSSSRSQLEAAKTNLRRSKDAPTIPPSPEPFSATAGKMTPGPLPPRPKGLLGRLSAKFQPKYKQQQQQQQSTALTSYVPMSSNHSFVPKSKTRNDNPKATAAPKKGSVTELTKKFNSKPASGESGVSALARKFDKTPPKKPAPSNLAKQYVRKMSVHSGAGISGGGMRDSVQKLGSQGKVKGLAANFSNNDFFESRPVKPAAPSSLNRKPSVLEYRSGSGCSSNTKFTGFGLTKAQPAFGQGYESGSDESEDDDEEISRQLSRGPLAGSAFPRARIPSQFSSASSIASSHSSHGSNHLNRPIPPVPGQKPIMRDSHSTSSTSTWSQSYSQISRDHFEVGIPGGSGFRQDSGFEDSGAANRDFDRFYNVNDGSSTLRKGMIQTQYDAYDTPYMNAGAPKQNQPPKAAGCFGFLFKR